MASANALRLERIGMFEEQKAGHYDWKSSMK